MHKLGWQTRDSRCFYSDPAHQLSQVRDISAPFSDLHGHNICLMKSWFSLSSVSVYYVAVRTIVLSRHGSSLARPVIIHDIIHGLIYVPSTPCCGFFWGLAGWKLCLRPLRFFYIQLKVSQTSHLIYVVL